MERTDIAVRIEKIQKAYGLNTNALERKLGMGKNGLRNTIMGKNSPSYEALLKILTIFPEINGNWLITGKGDPFIPVSEETGLDHKHDREQVLSMKVNGTYYNKVKSGCGYKHLCDETTQKVPVSLPFFDAELVVYHVNDMAMYPLFCEDDILVLKELKNYKSMETGKIYSVMSETEGFLGRVSWTSFENRSIRVNYDNASFFHTTVLVKDIVFVAEVVAVFSKFHDKYSDFEALSKVLLNKVNELECMVKTIQKAT